MKIKRFNESVEVEDIEKHLIYQYNQETEKEYVIKVITSDNNDLYVSQRYQVFEDLIKKYIEIYEYRNNKDNFYYIMEETKSRRIIPREELEPYLSANKYNL
jgi:hypothetical protein